MSAPSHPVHPRAAEDVPAGVNSPADDLAHAPVLASERHVSATDLVIVVISVLTAAVGQLLLRNGMQAARLQVDLGRGSLVGHAIRSPSIVGGLAIFGVSALLWMYALSRVPLSYAYPFNGLGFVLILLVSRFTLNEHVSLTRWIGAAVVFGGILLIVSGQAPESKARPKDTPHAAPAPTAQG